MSRRALLTPMILMVIGAVAAVLIAVGTSSSPTLGLDLEGGLSITLEAKAVDGKTPSEESVEKAKDIIRQRVDGLGVAEPDITRQGRTVIVQLPGVKNREKAEGLIGCTAKLEFRPVLSQTINPEALADLGDEVTTTVAGDETTTTSAGDATTTTAADVETTTTAAAGDETTTTTAPEGDGEGETGSGVVGIGTGEGALPGQFAPTTTTTVPPTTTTTAPPTTTTTPGETTTTIAPEVTTTTGPIVIDEQATCGETPVTEDGDTDTTAGDDATTTVPGGDDDTTSTTAPVDTAKSQVIVPSEDGQLLYTLGPVGFTGDALSSATAALDPTGAWLINVSVRGGAKDEANATFNACNASGPDCPPSDTGPGRVAIVLDGKVLSAPAVQSQNLADDTFTISGDFTEGDAKDLALVLRYGSLPVEFKQVENRQVSASLGRDSLNAGVFAGLVGVAILAIYMFLYYRGFGLVVIASLVIWAALMYGLVCFLSETQGLALTLAGITGIIVSVGTTVDTYVVVFERVKDELRAGRSVRVATERGYQSGIKTVFTANGAAFIGAFLLWILTVGPVRGFAYFLGLSVILDLAVAILFSRPLVLLLGRSPRFARSRFLGVGTVGQNAPAKGVSA